MWPDWAIYWTLGNFFKPLATINLPQSPTFLGNFCKGVKSIIFLVKSFLGNFDRHLAIFVWSHWRKLSEVSCWCQISFKLKQKSLRWSALQATSWTNFRVAQLWLRRNKPFWSAVFVAQLVERSLPTLDIRGSNPVIDKIYIKNC